MKRDMMKELNWCSHPIIGYVPVAEDGEPYQPILGRGHQQRKKPVTIYQTVARAETYSPCGCAAEVRMFKPTHQEVHGDD